MPCHYMFLIFWTLVNYGWESIREPVQSSSVQQTDFSLLPPPQHFLSLTQPFFSPSIAREYFLETRVSILSLPIIDQQSSTDERTTRPKHKYENLAPIFSPKFLPPFDAEAERKKSTRGVFASIGFSAFVCCCWFCYRVSKGVVSSWRESSRYFPIGHLATTLIRRLNTREREKMQLQKKRAPQKHIIDTVYAKSVDGDCPWERASQ